MRARFRRYWPWIVALGFLVGYEIVALITRIPDSGFKRIPTLSQMVWHGYDAFAPLAWIVIAVVGVLLVHFFWRKRKPPA